MGQFQQFAYCGEYSLHFCPIAPIVFPEACHPRLQFKGTSLPRQFTVAHILEIPIRIHVSLIAACLGVMLLAASVVQSMDPGRGRMWIVGCALLAALFYVASILLHEVGHALTLRSYGIEVEWITLNGLGGLTRATRQPDSPASEFAVSAAGPACTLLLMAMGLIFWRELAGTNRMLLRDLALLITILNTLTLPPALVPIWPTDGGHMLRALVWKVSRSPRAATRFACYQSVAIIGLLLFDGLLSLVHPILPGGQAAGFAALFLGLLLLPNLRGIFRTLDRLTPATVPIDR